MEGEKHTYGICFALVEMGMHTVCVTYKGQQVPGILFQFTVWPLREGTPIRSVLGDPSKRELKQECQLNSASGLAKLGLAA